MEDRKLYTSKEIAEIYRVTQYTVSQTWVGQGLPYVKGPGRSFLYKLSEVDEFIDNIKNIRTRQTNEITRKIKKIRNTCAVMVH